MVKKKTNIQVNRGIVAAGCLLLILSVALWRAKANSPQNVFWDMVGNNLSTRSITKHVIGDSTAAKSDQYTQVTFGAQNFSHNIVTLTQKSGEDNTVVKTESIGTPQADFSRYNSIQTNRKNAVGQLPDFSNIEGVWGKSSDQASAQYLSQAMFGVVPFANLNAAERARIVKLIKDSKVYSPAFDKVATQNGDYVYSVELSPVPYLKLLAELSKATGVHSLVNADVDDYKDSPSLKLTVSVDKRSHQLKKVKYDSGGQEETYESHGLNAGVQIPDKTIPMNELETRVANIQ